MNPCHKIYQTAEETQPILYTPIFLGNECIIVASQNQRRLNDATILNFCRFTANGELIPLEYITNDPAIYDYAFNTFRAQTMRGQNPTLMTSTTSLQELRARLLQAQGQNHPQVPSFFQKQQHEPLETMRLPTFHATKATSTTELTSQNVELPLCRRCGCRKPQIIAKTFATYSSCSRGCNTENLNTKLPEAYNACESTKKLNVFEQRKIRKNSGDIV